MALTKVDGHNDKPPVCLRAVQVGAIVPWNYPFHNVLNPLTAAIFAGNSVVIKVGAAWMGLVCVD